MVMEKPVTMAAIAALSVNFVQNRDMSIIGQNVAAIPAHPNITNQKIVRSGDAIDTVIAKPRESAANTIVMLRQSLAA